MRQTIGQFDAVMDVRERVQFNAKMTSAIHEAIGGMNAPIVIEADERVDLLDSFRIVR
ncbi:hypothetical protein MKK75_10875 [Methylobacterium sp. J-030]|uniref:hypothetical protein n=1 Tax=Methylobacterium sp. J-030 TaxID=2836627 RepID=UPI001FB9ADA0|nr:hypothetical protein [Methylobacterium sp. J-030]MCJ2069296.1 hypothetical protein [Methylobacterium sp. J-030]